ncbi:MAG TPA: hypothetical protein VGU02_02905 [Gaiellaceae bacterium]|nr:hypothetical protein [Gaiellaceae bacterium]
MALIKKVMLSLIVVGVLGTITVHRVAAVFVEEAVNTNSNVASATFTLDTTIGANTACSSDAGLNPVTQPNNITCTGAGGQLFAGTVGNFPGAPSTVQVKIKNTGSVDARDVQISMQNCQSGGTGALGALGATQSDPCTGVAFGGIIENGGLQLYIQETNSGGTNLTNGCLYPDPNAKPHSPADLPGTGTGYATCAANWQNNSFADFYSKSCWDLGRLSAGATRYFTIGMEFQTDSPNSYQATNAKFDLTWHADSVDGTYTPSACAND